MKILVIHGTGWHAPGGDWREEDFAKPITRALEAAGAGKASFDFFEYCELTAQPAYDLDVWSWIKAAGTGIGGWLGLGKARGGGAGQKAAMVVKWMAHPALRAALRKALAAKLKAVKPDLVVAHSLGSLIAYDTLYPGRPETQDLDFGGLRLLTLGSQIANPGVLPLFQRLVGLPCATWTNLYNPEDAVLVMSLEGKITREAGTDPRFTELRTFFDLAGMGDHDASAYLGDDQALPFWRSLAAPKARGRAAEAKAPAPRAPRRRALLVGIDHYQEITDLDGCVNDLWLMNKTIQERGFEARDIRTLSNSRATLKALRERLHWLVEGAREGDELLFHYSGHGGQIPGYGPEEVDHLDECLCPHDFDGEQGYADQEFLQLYSQLPYGTRFTVLLDCCHSGGMPRGRGRIRGVGVHPDLRHRALRWDAAIGQWVPRTLPGQGWNADLGEDYTGKGGVVRRLGRATELRGASDAAFDTARAAGGHRGPYLPLILMACAEGQFAYEMEDGNTPHGAFTYHLARLLAAKTRKPRSVAALVKALARPLGADQTPQVLGPKARLEHPLFG